MSQTKPIDKVELIKKVAVGYKILEGYYDEAVVTNYVKALESVPDVLAIQFIDDWLKNNTDRMPAPAHIRQTVNRRLRETKSPTLQSVAPPTRAERDKIVNELSPKLRASMGMRPRLVE